MPSLRYFHPTPSLRFENGRVFLTTCVSPPPQSLLLVFLNPLVFHFLTFSSISIAHVRFSVFCFYIFSLFLGTFCVFLLLFRLYSECRIGCSVVSHWNRILVFLIQRFPFTFTLNDSHFFVFFKYQAIFQYSYLLIAYFQSDRFPYFLQIDFSLFNFNVYRTLQSDLSFLLEILVLLPSFLVVLSLLNVPYILPLPVPSSCSYCLFLRKQKHMVHLLKVPSSFSPIKLFDDFIFLVFAIFCFLPFSAAFHFAIFFSYRRSPTRVRRTSVLFCNLFILFHHQLRFYSLFSIFL